MSSSNSNDVATEQNAGASYFTRKGLQDRFVVSERTTYEWQKQGLIEPVRLGGIVRFTAESVAALDKRLRDEGSV